MYSHAVLALIALIVVFQVYKFYRTIQYTRSAQQPSPASLYVWQRSLFLILVFGVLIWFVVNLVLGHR